MQWVKHSAYPALTCGASQDALWPASSDANLCKASFSGTPGCSAFNLAPNTCITVEIGNVDDSICGVGPENCGAAELDCGTEYVFHAFAHNVPGGQEKRPYCQPVLHYGVVRLRVCLNPRLLEDSSVRVARAVCTRYA